MSFVGSSNNINICWPGSEITWFMFIYLKDPTLSLSRAIQMMIKGRPDVCGFWDELFQEVLLKL